MDINWFNASPGFLRIGDIRIQAFNCFNRRATTGHFWGVGLLQINKRHLFYVGGSGISILFIGKSH